MKNPLIALVAVLGALFAIPVTIGAAVPTAAAQMGQCANPTMTTAVVDTDDARIGLVVQCVPISNVSRGCTAPKGGANGQILGPVNSVQPECRNPYNTDIGYGPPIGGPQLGY